MAGHDINYLAVSGVLGMLGRAGEKPYAPGNLVGDFAGGGAVCFMGILLALLQRDAGAAGGRGQVVEANMVDGSAYMASMPRLAAKTPMWDASRGENLLDSGCPYYDTYETNDGKHMAVGALEPQFFAALLRGLEIDPVELGGRREDKATWPRQAQLFAHKFKSKSRAEWEAIFDATDACVTPVLSQTELEAAGFDQRPIVTLKSSPGLAISGAEFKGRLLAEGQSNGVEGDGWSSKGLSPGVGGEEILAGWTGWTKGLEYCVRNGGLEYISNVHSSKL